MHPTSSRPGRGPDETRTGYRRRRTSRTLLTALACLAALGCLAGLVIAKLHRSPLRPTALFWPTAWPSGTSTPAAGSVTPRQLRLGAVSWPADGASAADVSGFGVVYGPGATRPVPIASVAKVMTAYVILRWDAGSQAAFVARMNATARRLGMTDTSYTDPSGLASSTVSTAADQVRLGLAAMRVPALAAIAAMPTAVVPEAGVVRNYNTLLGQDGIAGLKTGSTQAAGGCVLIAAWHQASGHGTLIVAATFGQPGTAQTILPNALQAGHNLVLTLDTALDAGAQTGSLDNSVGPPQGPGRAHDDQKAPPAHG